MIRPLIALSLSLTACDGALTDATEVDHGEATTSACGSLEATGWTEESHAKGHDGDYERVFDDTRVRRLDITICAEDYEAMQEDLEALLGSSTGGGPGGGGPGGGGDLVEGDPVYVPVNIGYDGQTWPSVGMRYKGNSSLSHAWQSGVEKLPFRLSMDEYEDSVPEVDDQRFWGFKDLKLSSAHLDDTLMRDKLAADAFRDAGVPAAKGAFVRVYVDIQGDGEDEGPVYWGLYTMFEDPAGELLDSWFGDDDGNAYKPDGDSATLADFDAADFEKKTNEEEGDYSDVQALVALLADERSDRGAWREELEAVADVEGFLNYLALNNLIGNWDSYGNMTHNYYLYGDPALGGALVWIPWDFNESYSSTMGMGALSVGLDEVGEGWPMIRALMDDPVYAERYAELVEGHLSGDFAVGVQDDRVAAYEALIADWVEAEEAPYTNRSGAFDTSPLIDRVMEAHDEAEAWLTGR